MHINKLNEAGSHIRSRWDSSVRYGKELIKNDSFTTKAKNIAVNIVKIMALALFFFTSSTLFLLGFIAAYAKPEFFKNIRVRIIENYSKAHIAAKIAIPIFALFALPNLIFIGSFFAGSSFAEWLQSNSESQSIPPNHLIEQSYVAHLG